jgi:EAL and modified HD-GYP domain-containing signal transduction protein
LFLLARLSDPAIEFEEVERLLAQDVQLTYKLLKLVNAVWFARRTRVESLRQALLVLGLRSVAAWVAVLVLAGIERKPVELVRTALVRARMCELVAGALGVSSRETAFLTGLLSVLDAALDVPLADALAELPLTSEVTEALLYHRGPLGRVLAAVLSYEVGHWSPLADLPITPMLLTEAFIDALAFAAQALVGLDLAP